MASFQAVTRDALRDDAVASAFQIDTAVAAESLKTAVLRPADMDGVASDVLISSGQSLLPSPDCCGSTVGLYVRSSDQLSILFVSFFLELLDLFVSYDVSSY